MVEGERLRVAFGCGEVDGTAAYPTHCLFGVAFELAAYACAALFVAVVAFADVALWFRHGAPRIRGLRACG